MKFAPVVFGFLAVACGAQLDFSDVPLPRDDTFGVSTPAPVDQGHFDDASAYLQAHNGVHMLVVQGTDIVYEWTRSDYDPVTPRHLFSGTKSFSCALGAVLEQDGVLDLDASVMDTIPELAAGPDVTARHLLHFTSGIEQRWLSLSTDGMAEEQRVDDKYAFAVELDSQWESGSKFEYGSSHLMVFGELVSRLTDSDPLAVLDTRVFEPIGMSYGGWHRDPEGNAMLPYGAWTTSYEWAKFGVLIRDDGMWQGERVLPGGVRDACATGSEANPSYGLTWWLNAPLGEDADIGAIGLDGDGQGILHPTGYPDAFVAAGHNGQRLYIVPSLDLVVAVLSDGDRTFADREFATRLLP